MEKQGLFRSIVNAVIQEEKKKYARKPLDPWYRIMNFIDNLEEENAETAAESETT